MGLTSPHFLQRFILRGYDRGTTLKSSVVRKSLAAFLYVAFHELLGVRLEHGVDLVQEVVELFLQFLALLGRRRHLGGLLDALLGRRLLLALTLRHVRRSSCSSLEPFNQLGGGTDLLEQRLHV